MAGVEQTVMIVNYNDIDRAATVFDADKDTITTLTLKAGKRAYELPGFKLSNNPGFTIVKKDIVPDAFSHNFSGVVMQFDKGARQNLRKLNADNRVVVIVENKFKGEDNEYAFDVYGYNSGLALGGDTQRNLNENSGTLQLQLITVEGEEEPHEPYRWLDTDYATTKAAFDALSTP